MITVTLGPKNGIVDNSFQFSVFSFQFSVFSFQFSVFSFQFSVFSFQFSVFSFQSDVITIHDIEILSTKGTGLVSDFELLVSPPIWPMHHKTFECFLKSIVLR